MRFLKKILLILAIGIITVSLGLYVYVQIWKSQSSRALIHRDSQRVLVIALDRILIDIAKNAITNPTAYRKQKDSVTTRKEVNLWDIGIDIPPKIYFFSSANDSLTFYSIQRVADKAKLKQYLTLLTDDILLDEQGEILYALSQKKHISFLVDQQKVIIACGKLSENSKSYMEHLLSEKNTDIIAVKDFKKSDIEKQQADITFIDTEQPNKIEIDFNAGHVKLSALWKSDLWRIDKNASMQGDISEEDNILHIRFNADIRPLLHKYRSSLLQYNIPIDTIQPYIGNYWEFHWKKGEVIQEDTIITYDYDDNFEMTEKQEIRNVTVPNLNFLIKASPHLLSFLPEKIFYKFNHSIEGDLISLRTQKFDPAGSVKRKMTDHVFSLNYRSCNEVDIFKHQFSWLEKIDAFQLEGKYIDEYTIQFVGEIKLTDSKIHALYQWIN